MPDSPDPSGMMCQGGNVSMGDIGGDIRDTIIAGRDVIIYEGVKPVSAGELLDACEAQVDDVLFRVRHKYNRDLYVNRAIERELEAFFDAPFSGPAPNCYLIVAPAGSGKTNLLCDLARRRVHRQPVLLVLGGNAYVGSEAGLLSTFQNELQAAKPNVLFRNAMDSLHTLHRLAEELDRDALLFVDAINEYGQPAVMRQAIEDLLSKTRRKRIKLVITCRDYYWGLFRGIFWEGAMANALPPEDDELVDYGSKDRLTNFASDEYDRALQLYLQHYNIDGRPVRDAAEHCRHPLLLLFFCEAYRGQEIGEVEDIRLKELFDHYWERKLASIAEKMVQQGEHRLQRAVTAEIGDYLLNLAFYMLHHSVRAIAVVELARATGLTEESGDLRSAYGRIRDEFIILEEIERGEGRCRALQVAFVYEEFMEYVMARSLIRAWDYAGLDQAGILAEIESLANKYESFAQILGVMVYLSLMLKASRGLALWSLLLDKDEQWRTVIFETFHKLPTSELDAGVFDVLGQMLNMRDEGIEIQVLDTLKLGRLGSAAPRYMVGNVAKLASDKREPIARRAALALGNMSTDQAVLALLKASCHPRKSVRQNALASLEKSRHKSLEVFISALNNGDKNVRRAAATALGQLNDARAVEHLVATLADRSPQVKEAAAMALGNLGDARAVQPLTAMLRDRNVRVKQAAAVALGKLGDVRAADSLVLVLQDLESQIKKEAGDALRQLGGEVIEPLRAALQDGDEVARLTATAALGEIWSLPDMVLLGSSSWKARTSGAQALGQVRDLRIVEPLVAALKDSSENVREAVVKALAQVGDMRAVESLIATLSDRDEGVRQAAITALGQLRDVRAVEPLITVLQRYGEDTMSIAFAAIGRIWSLPDVGRLGRTSSRERADGAQALGQLRDVRAVEPLIELLYDPTWSVRMAAAEALGQIGEVRAVEPLITLLLDRKAWVRQKTAAALGQLRDVQAVEPLVTVLVDDDSRVRQAAATALGQLADDRAVRPLVTALNDADGSVRLAAVTSLGRIWSLPDVVCIGNVDWRERARGVQAVGQWGDVRAVPPLMAALQDQELRVRKEAAKAFRQLGDEAMEYLMVMLKDGDENARLTATIALGEIWSLPDMTRLGSRSIRERISGAQVLGQLEDVRAVEPLIAALRDTNDGARQAAVTALGQLRDARAVEPLIAILDGEDQNVRRAAVTALGQIWSLPDVIRLGSSSWTERVDGAQALGRLREVRAVSPLVSTLQDEEHKVRWAAASALGQVGDVRAVGPLVGLLCDADRTTRSEAVLALALVAEGAPEYLVEAIGDNDRPTATDVIEVLRLIGTPDALEMIPKVWLKYSKRRSQA